MNDQQTVEMSDEEQELLEYQEWMNHMEQVFGDRE